MDLFAADGDFYRILYNDLLKSNKISGPTAQPTRFVLPLNIPEGVGNNKENLVTLAGTTCTAFKVNSGHMMITGEKLSDTFGEMPRINYKRNGVKYRYFYAVGYTKNNMKYYKLFKVLFC